MSETWTETPAAFRAWFCGGCQYELVVLSNCPCCPSELSCHNCDARFNAITGEFLRIGGAA